MFVIPKDKHIFPFLDMTYIWNEAGHKQFINEECELNKDAANIINMKQAKCITYYYLSHGFAGVLKNNYLCYI